MRRPFTIFIVEDNTFYTFFLNEFLREHGNFNITTFETAEHCLNAMDTRPDLVIHDYFLDEGMDGGEAFKILHQKFPDVPVIMLTAQPDLQIALNLVRQGVYGYIEKKDKQAMVKLKNAILELSSRQRA